MVTRRGNMTSIMPFKSVNIDFLNQIRYVPLPDLTHFENRGNTGNRTRDHSQTC